MMYPSVALVPPCLAMHGLIVVQHLLHDAPGSRLSASQLGDAWADRHRAFLLCFIVLWFALVGVVGAGGFRASTLQYIKLLLSSHCLVTDEFLGIFLRVITPGHHFFGSFTSDHVMDVQPADLCFVLFLEPSFFSNQRLAICFGHLVRRHGTEISKHQSVPYLGIRKGPEQ